MLDRIEISNVLFIDIETVSSVSTFSELSNREKEHWRKKCQFLLRLPAGEVADDDAASEAYQNRAGIYAEFGKIVCISIGYVLEPKQEMRLKSFYGEDEKGLLLDFVSLITRHYNNPNKHGICGHNVREFDIPFLCRRLIIHGIPLPPMFNLAGKKPWETKYIIDTMQLWKFGDFKNFTSLDLLASVLGVDTPKDDIDGSMVGQVFWQDKDLARIATYCEKDVVTVAQVLLRMMGMDKINEDSIVSV